MHRPSISRLNDAAFNRCVTAKYVLDDNRLTSVNVLQMFPHRLRVTALQKRHKLLTCRLSRAASLSAGRLIRARAVSVSSERRMMVSMLGKETLMQDAVEATLY